MKNLVAQVALGAFCEGDRLGSWLIKESLVPYERYHHLGRLGGGGWRWSWAVYYKRKVGESKWEKIHSFLSALDCEFLSVTSYLRFYFTFIRVWTVTWHCGSTKCLLPYITFIKIFYWTKRYRTGTELNFFLTILPDLLKVSWSCQSNCVSAF